MLFFHITTNLKCTSQTLKIQRITASKNIRVRKQTYALTCFYIISTLKLKFKPLFLLIYTLSPLVPVANDTFINGR